MASPVDICNLALSNIGNDANVSSIDPTDGTVEADKCATFYPIARDAILEMHAWRFATRRASLAELADNPVDHWLFAYAVPTQLIRPLAVLPPESTDDTATQDFTVESGEDGAEILYTNQEDAVLKYIVRVEDTAKFTPLFIVALARLLGSYLAGVLPKDLKLAESELKKFMQVDFPNAAASDAIGQKNNAYGARHVPGHISARY